LGEEKDWMAQTLKLSGEKKSLKAGKWGGLPRRGEEGFFGLYSFVGPRGFSEEEKKPGKEVIGGGELVTKLDQPRGGKLEDLETAS